MCVRGMPIPSRCRKLCSLALIPGWRPSQPPYLSEPSQGLARRCVCQCHPPTYDCAHLNRTSAASKSAAPPPAVLQWRRRTPPPRAGAAARGRATCTCLSQSQQPHTGRFLLDRRAPAWAAAVATDERQRRDRLRARKPNNQSTGAPAIASPGKGIRGAIRP